ncbi:MAG: hypothetical protein KY429_00425 [Actinobacteria bacterium]|nr:hypothetical protein [Actinomycetota bacterium]
MSVRTGGYPRRKRGSRDSEQIKVLSPLIVEMTEEQLEEASDILAELLVKCIMRRSRKEGRGRDDGEEDF